ncbi:MAG: L,D-transpeptidase family protein [Acidobacteriota bacterium]
MRPTFVTFLFLSLSFVSSMSAQIKKPDPPAVKVPFSGSLQAVAVITDNADSIHGKARLFQRRSTRDPWKSVGEYFPVVVGRSGLAWDVDSAPVTAREFKKEGDGRSPAGMMPLTAGFGVSEKPEGLRLPYTRLGEFTECVDDTASTHYNRIVDRLKVGNFDWKSSEKMLAIGEQYSLGVFVAYNSYPVLRGNGSCIFLHVWKDADSGTSGCTAMARPDLERLAAWLDPAKTPYLVQLTASQYKQYQRSWNLPKQ